MPEDKSNESKARTQYIVDSIKNTTVSDDKVLYIVDKSGKTLIKVYND